MGKLLIILLVICNSIDFLNAQWQWVYPRPQGHNLTSISFANTSIGIVGGASGTILKTTNGGIFWTYKNIGLNYDFDLCYMLNLNTGFASGYFGRIFKTTNGGDNWNIITADPIASSYCIFFLNQNTGFVSGHSYKLYKTTDCGSNWSFDTIPYLYSIKAIKFFNGSTGIIAGGGPVYKILRTVNGGLYWDTVDYKFDNVINSINFVNNLTGYVIGTNKIMAKTRNGGLNWYQIPITDNCINMRSIKFINPNTGFYIGDNDTVGKIYKTINGGNNWESCCIDSSAFFLSIDTAGTNIICTGTVGRIIYSTNYGMNWNSYSDKMETNFWRVVRVHDENNLVASNYINYNYVFSKLNIYRSTNGGLNWFSYANHYNLTNKSINKIYFYDMNTGFAIGRIYPQNGLIMKTTNGGMTWIDKANIFNVVLNDIHFLNLNTGLTCGTTGNIIITSNGGENWTIVSSGGPHSQSVVRYFNENFAYLVNSNGDVCKSTNGGYNWIITAQIGRSINTIRYTDQLTGYFGADGVYKTTDGGYNWAKIFSGFTCPSLDFYNSNTGFVSRYDGKIYRTTNGGINWIDESYVSNSITITGYHFITSEIVYASGRNTLLKTTNGGILTVLAKNREVISQNYFILQNYPNPFNPNTNIRYQLTNNLPVQMSLKVFDIMGKEVATLVNEKQTAGTYEVRWVASNYPSGVYFYKLTAGDYTDTKRMILIK